MKKKCQQCRKEFQKPYFESKKDWAVRHKFCSTDCKKLSQKTTLKGNTRGFKKGQVAWNKGKPAPA